MDSSGSIPLPTLDFASQSPCVSLGVTGAQAPRRTGQGPADALAVWLWRAMGLQLEGDRWDAGEDFIFCDKIKSCLYADGNDLVDRFN